MLFSSHRQPKRRLSFKERLFKRFFYNCFARNVFYELQLRAMQSSADYVEAHMPEAVVFWHLYDILAFGVRRAPATGMLLEFGVHNGNTLRMIAEVAGATRAIYGFDSFRGLPEDWAGHLETKGSFDLKGRMPTVPAHVQLVAGWFDETLPGFLAAHPGQVAYLHVDCDLYSSTRTVLWALADRLAVGTIIEFDEYFNYPNWQQHEYKAWAEFVAEFSVRYRYLAYSAGEGRVTVEVTGIGNSRSQSSQ
jgi:hypothetical protein